MRLFKKTSKPKTKRKKVRVDLEWMPADDVAKDIVSIVETLNMSHIRIGRIFCYRTQGSKAKAYARTWMIPKIFQQALGIQPAYVIEVISKYYDELPDNDKTEVLIHELLHIPKNFSGALVSHSGRNRRLHHDARRLLQEYNSIIKN